jgi:uncharacterized protein YbbK (DUF523 family)
MPEILTDRPVIGVSACLYDCPVRYNGKRFDAVSRLGREKGDFRFMPVCPECMAGFGVPREPIHLTGPGEDVLAGAARVVNRRGRDVTADLVAGAQACADALERAGVRVVILKEESPSCGLLKTRVGDGRREERVKAAGVFGALLARTGRFLVPDAAFDSPLKWWDWRRRMHAWLWLSGRSVRTNGELADAWHVVKFIVQETQRTQAEAIGRAIAALPRRAAEEELLALRERMLEALRAPTTPQRALAALWKAYTYHRKRGTLEGVDLHELTVRSPEVRRNATALAQELLVLERVSFENDLLFAPSPVLYRERRRVRARDEALGRTSDRKE